MTKRSSKTFPTLSLLEGFIFPSFTLFRYTRVVVITPHPLEQLFTPGLAIPICRKRTCRQERGLHVMEWENIQAHVQYFVVFVLPHIKLWFKFTAEPRCLPKVLLECRTYLAQQQGHPNSWGWSKHCCSLQRMTLESSVRCRAVRKRRYKSCSSRGDKQKPKWLWPG